MSATIQSITSIRSAFAARQKAVRVVVVPLLQHKTAVTEPVVVNRRKKQLRQRVALMAEVAGILGSQVCLVHPRKESRK